MKQDKAMTLPGSASYFDEVAEEYTSRYHSQTPGGYALRVRKQRTLELLGEVGGKVLDVGCGPGVMVPELLDLGYEFWGMDAAPGMIEQCEIHFGEHQKAHFSTGSATNLVFPDNFFDAVVCTGVLDRVEGQEKAIKEMIRVLKPEGTLIVSFPNLISPYAAWKNYVFYPIVAILRPIYYGLLGRSQPPSLYGPAGRPRLPSLNSSFASLHTARTPVKLMAKDGVEVTDVVYYYFNIFLSPIDELFPRLVLEVTKRLERLRFGKLKWLGVGFIYKGKKRP